VTKHAKIFRLQHLILCSFHTVVNSQIKFEYMST